MSDRRVTIGFPASRDLVAWERRFEAGEVPSRWPYGLDGLERFVDHLDHVPLSAPSRSARFVARLRLRSGHPFDALGVTWDESSAYQLALVAGGAPRYSGVVWLTDRIAERGVRPYSRVLAELRRCSGLWVLSRAQLQPLRETLGESAPPVDFVRFGVDAEFFRPGPVIRQPMVLSVGGDRDRDPASMLSAMRLIHRARPDVRLVLQTRSRVVPPDGVEVVPRIPHRELAELYSKASVVAVATRPNLHVSGMTVSLEAMASGRPVVITRSPGMTDYVADGVTGALVAPGDPSALAASVLTYLGDEAGATETGRRGRASVEEGMTTAHLTEGIARVLRLA